MEENPLLAESSHFAPQNKEEILCSQRACILLRKTRRMGISGVDIFQWICNEKKDKIYVSGSGAQCQLPVHIKLSKLNGICPGAAGIGRAAGRNGAAGGSSFAG